MSEIIKPTKNKVKFVHFNGKESEWNQKIADSCTWDNAIVFGKVWDASMKCNMKIYAGKDSVDSSTFIYDAASLQQIVEIEKKIDGIQSFLSLDASNHFDNSTMKYALESFIANDSTTIQNIMEYLTEVDTSLKAHQQKIDDLDISINQINKVLEETIHWLDENGQWIDPSEGE